jgi:hypothetical protein
MHSSWVVSVLLDSQAPSGLGARVRCPLGRTKYQKWMHFSACVCDTHWPQDELLSLLCNFLKWEGKNSKTLKTMVKI